MCILTDSRETFQARAFKKLIWTDFHPIKLWLLCNSVPAERVPICGRSKLEAIGQEQPLHQANLA